MFSEIPDDSIMLERVDITSTMQDILEECFLSVQYVAETSMMLNESSFAQSKFTEIIDAIISYVKRAFDKLIAMLDGRFANLEAVIRKYRPQLEALRDEDVKDLVFDKVTYTISPNVPAMADMSFITTHSKITLSSVNRTSVENLREKIAATLPFTRAKIMGLSKPVFDGQVDGKVKKLFKQSSEISETRMRAADVRQIIADVASYPTDKKSIKNADATITQMLNTYKRQINDIYSSTPVTDSHDRLITIDGKTKQVDALQAAYFREYQLLLGNFIMGLSNLYSAIYDAKLSALQEKFLREQTIIRQLISLIQ